MSVVPKIVRRVPYPDLRLNRARKNHVRCLKFESLEERLALNAAPILQGLPEVLYLTPGTSYHVALDGKDDDGDDLTFTADQTNDQLLTATVLEGNQSIKFSVYYQQDDVNWTLVGDIIFELFEDDAPISTQRFKDLVNGMRGSDGAMYEYDGSPIHRILDGFMFQGGDVKYGNGYGGTGINIADEFVDYLQHSSRGIVSFANSGPGKTDSQFFITDKSTDWLDGKHNVFGFVTEGDDVRDAIGRIPVVKTTSDPNEQASWPMHALKMDDFGIFTDDENGTLRITVPEDAEPGQTTLTVYVSDGVNEPVPYTITVNVIEEPTSVPAWNTPTTLDLDAGESYTFTLPDYPIPGEVEYIAERIPGYSSEDLEVIRNGRDVTIVVPEHVGGLQAIRFYAVPRDMPDAGKPGGDFDYAYGFLSVFVTPKAPVLSLAPDADTGTDGDNVTARNNDAAGNELIFEVSDMLEELAAGKNTTMNLYQDGNEVECELVAQTRQDNGLWTWTVKMKVPSTPKPLVDGTYEFTVVQTYTFTETMGHEPVTSTVSRSLQVVVDTGGPAFVLPDSTIYDAKVDEPLRIEFKTDNHVTSKPTYEITAVVNGQGESIEVPDGMQIDASTGVLTWTPAAGQVDDYTITVKATDGAGKSAQKTIEVIFQGGPEFSITGNTTLDEGDRFVLELEVTEDDFTGTVEFELKEGTLPDHIEYTLEMTGDRTAVFTWSTTEADGPATYSPVFVVKDTQGQTRRKDILLTVREIDSAPYFSGEEGEGDGWVLWNSDNSEGFYFRLIGGRVGTSGVITISEHADFMAQFSAGDDDRDPNGENTLTYSLQGNYPTGMTVDPETGLVSWIPGESHGDHSFNVTVRVTDKTGLYDELTLSLYIEETDSPPVFEEGNDRFAARTGDDFSAQLSARDSDYYVDPEAPIHKVVYTVAAAEGEELPEGLTIDPETGRIVWAIPYDYIETAVSGKAITVIVTATEVDSEGVSGFSAVKTIVIDLTNQSYLDAVAEEAARHAARNTSGSFSVTDGLLAGDELWMMLEGFEQFASGSAQQIYSGDDPTANSGFRSILNPFQLSTTGSSGVVLDDPTKTSEEEGDTKKPQEEEQRQPRSQRPPQSRSQESPTRSSQRQPVTRTSEAKISDEFIRVSWQFGVYDDVDDGNADEEGEEEKTLRNAAVRFEPEMFGDGREGEIFAVAPELEDAIACILP